MSNSGGYENLLVYQLAITIFDLTVTFCNRYIDKRSRTLDQMVQAGRSGKQNIAEGSLEKSLKSYIKLVGVSRGSFGELLEDYKDYLRQNNLLLWLKEDSRVDYIRSIRENSNLPNWANSPNSPYIHILRYLDRPENFANLLIVLLYKENYLLDQLNRSLEEKFIKDGGYTENLFKKRLDFMKHAPPAHQGITV